jgi:hypothetical protein
MPSSSNNSGGSNARSMALLLSRLCASANSERWIGDVIEKRHSIRCICDKRIAIFVIVPQSKKKYSLLCKSTVAKRIMSLAAEQPAVKG